MANWITANDTSAFLESLISGFCAVVGGLAGAEVTAAPAAAEPAAEPGPDALSWLQGLDLGPRARFAVSAPAASWRGLGVAPLVALGEVAGADDETARSTYLEYLAQLGGMAASALSEQAGRQVLPIDGQETLEWPTGWLERTVELQLGDSRFPVRFAVAPDFFGDAGPEQPDEAPGAERGHDSEATALVQRSGTFDLLLEVELAVSISFGRAMVPLRDVARLTSGSVVELNRTISDPVEVIVNNCVIARGEVVVVEGNYGVRIQQIISPRERLRTLH